MVTCQGGEPQRQLGQVHGENVLVHAVEASFGHEASRVGEQVLVVGHLRRGLVYLPCVHEALGQQAARLDQERARTHGGVAHLQVQNLIRRGLLAVRRALRLPTHAHRIGRMHHGRAGCASLGALLRLDRN